ALGLVGRYSSARSSVDLDEFEGRVFMTPLAGGVRAELRVPSGPDAERATDFVADDAVSYGARVTLVGDGRIVIGRDTLRRSSAPERVIVPVIQAKPNAVQQEFASLVGEYGWDHDVLYIREKDGHVNALIEWFFEYPLERVSRDVYRFPNFGL